MTGVKANSLFAIKCYLKDKPYPVLILGLGISVLVLGISIRLFEADGDFNFYLIIITMTTIGFGDMYPVTYFGRAVCIISCVWGVFIISMFTVALMKASEFTMKEQIVYEDITRRKRLNNDAMKIVQSYLLLTVYRKANINKDKRSELLLTLISKLSRFKRQGHDFSVKGLDQSTEIIEDLSSWMEEVHENYHDLFKKIKKANDYSRKLAKIINSSQNHEASSILYLADSKPGSNPKQGNGSQGKPPSQKKRGLSPPAESKKVIQERKERFQNSKHTYKARSSKTVLPIS